MYNEVDRARIEACIEHIESIDKYTVNILVAEDFLKAQNHIVFDATLMRLQALGELLKILYSKKESFADDLKYPSLRNVIRFRDLLSHHYDKVGHVDILNLIRNSLPELKNCLQTLLNKL